MNKHWKIATAFLCLVLIGSFWFFKLLRETTELTGLTEERLFASLHLWLNEKPLERTLHEVTSQFILEQDISQTHIFWSGSPMCSGCVKDCLSVELWTNSSEDHKGIMIIRSVLHEKGQFRIRYWLITSDRQDIISASEALKVIESQKLEGNKILFGFVKK